MPEKDGNYAEIDAIIAELSGDAEYPLPEQKPVKYTNIDIAVMPHGYKSEYPKPEAKDSLPRFVDSISHLDLDAAEEVDGILKVPAVIANSSHVYDYDGFKVHKPFEELAAAATFADGIPVTCEHPPAGVVTDRAQVLGFLREPVAENDMLKGILEITGKDLIADVKAGKRVDVSPGFFCELDTSEEGKGELEGSPYDATQRNIFLNHVGVCEKGRCSSADGCGIGLDAKKTPVPDKDSNSDSTDDPLTLQKVKDALELLKTERDNAIAERDSLQKQLEAVVNAEKDAIIAELTSLQDAKGADELKKLQLAELKKELDMVKQMKANRLLVSGDQGQSSGRKCIDDAYAKIGGR